MTAHPYRTLATPPRDRWSEVLLFVGRFVRLREHQWYRQRVGGTWLLLCATFVSSAPEWWHHEGVDRPPALSAYIIEREEWP